MKKVSLQPYCTPILFTFEAVKILRFIFALYILFMTVYPCSDKETCADERKAGITFVTVTDHDHTSSEVDQCTPFCICACCAANVQLNQIADIAFTNLVHNTLLATLYREQPVLTPGNSIWQPPPI